MSRVNVLQRLLCRTTGWAVALGTAVFASLCFVRVEGAERRTMMVKVDPVMRYVHITYTVPPNAPDEVVVLCSWSPAGKDDWKPAKVMPVISETALRLTDDKQWNEWVKGRLIERRAAGLQRTVIFNPYPEAQVQGRVDVEFRVQVQSSDGKVLSTEQTRVHADNSDVVYIEDWSQVIQRDAVASDVKSGERKWSWRTNADGVTFGNALHGKYADDVPLPPLTYPLNLRGWYAVFVCTAPHYGMRLRLTGDERSDTLGSNRPSEEVLWRWCRMERQHLVLKQPHAYTGYVTGQIDYVKLVPLSEEQAKKLNDEFGKADKLIAGYFEPYSWAFYEDVQETLQHREPLVAFAEARIDIVDIQIGRFGDKVVYESRLTDPLIGTTFGDPIGNVRMPTTQNVGKMQQFTNTLQTELRYARELGMTPHANFGGTNCYPGTPLQSDFSKQHPEWMRGHALRYEVPEVRQYILSLYREALEIGAPGISIDFCRYPEGIDKPETCTAFLRELKKLRDEFARARGKPVPLVIRFPAQGVRLWQNFDYATWAREGLVDTLCPSNIQGRHIHFDIAPYVKTVRGTECTLLPVVDGLGWGPEMPGFFLWRVKQLYDAGVDGIYVYQADGRILGRPEDRRCARLLASSAAVRDWWKRHEQTRPQRSKGIYITPFLELNGYHGWERIRVWLEGIETGAVEIYLDGKLVSKHSAPPYVVGTEEYDSDGVISPGEHILRVRAKDGDGWLEQTFTIQGAG